MQLTLTKIKQHNPCVDGWKKLNKSYPDRESVTLMEILESNGIKDACWVLRCLNNQKPVMLFAADVAESVLHIYEGRYPDDSRVRDCIDAVRRYCRGEITTKELDVYREAAVEAARAAGWAAWSAARVAWSARAAAEAESAAWAAAEAAEAAEAAAGDAEAAARDEKWDEIKNLFITRFGGGK